MRLFLSALTTGLILAAPVIAGGDLPTGNWKFSIVEQGQQIPFWLVHLEKNKEGKLVATADPIKGAPRVKLDELKQAGDTFSIKFRAITMTKEGPQEILFEYEGKSPKVGAKVIYGSLSQGQAMVPAVMEATTAKTPLDLDRELLQKSPSDPKAFSAILEVITAAKENKVEAKELQTWVDASVKASEMFGPRFQLKHQMRLISILQGQKDYKSVGIATARKLSKEIDASVPLDAQLQLTAMLADYFRINDLKDEAKKFTTDSAARISKLVDAKTPLEDQLKILSIMNETLRDMELKDEAKKFAIDLAGKINQQFDDKTPVETQLKVLAQVTEVLRSNDAKDAAKKIVSETAPKIAKRIDDKTPMDTQLQILSSLTTLLRGNDLKAESNQFEVRIEKLEGVAYADYAKQALNFKTDKFKGRKIKSDRAVLVELFTGAQCPPCVAADMAFDGLEKTYGPNEVVLLQYHMHIPRPEPMSNLDSEARFEFYAETYPKQIRGTPACLFNGKPEASGGGFRDEAPEKFKEFSAVVNKLLEAEAPLKLSASAVRTGEKIAISASVKNLAKPGEKTRLRLVLVEDWVRYKGTNGLQYHHRVVRALPGGAKGVSLKEKDFEHKARVDLDDLRKTLNKYLNEDYPDGPRPMRLRNLSVVAFVQNDESSEVLQAINVPVKQDK